MNNQTNQTTQKQNPNNKEILKRNVNLEGVTAEKENDELRLSGHAAVFERATVLYEFDGVEYKEVIARGAFDNCDMSRCCLKYNHSDSYPVLSRVRGGFLDLSVDSVGLRFDAKLFDTQASRDIYNTVKQGGIDKCSFAFTVEDETYDKLTHTRTINKIGKLFDVSVVDIPAYDDTDVSARDFFKAEAEKVKALESAEEDKRKRLKLKLMLSD